MRLIRFALKDCGLAAMLAAFVVSPSVGRAATFTTIGTIPARTDGANPSGGLTHFGSAYYGTTYDGGTQNQGSVYRIDLKTGAESVIYTFTGAADGGGPQAGLVAYDGELYGTTAAGGANGSGVVFSVAPATGAEMVVADLPAHTAAAAQLVAHEGLLYGTGYFCAGSGNGCVFSVDPASHAYTELYDFLDRDGNGPGLLYLHNGNLFGTTINGGRLKYGTLFRFDPQTVTLHIEHDFGGSDDGKLPAATLTSLNGVLYGVTSQGGNSGQGTIFSLDPGHRQESVVYSFTSADGNPPLSFGLANDGRLLYGTTSNGGAAGSGILYSFEPQAAQFQVLHDFSKNGPGTSTTSLVVAHGEIYGISADGALAGLIYSVDGATGQLSVVHEFGGLDSSALSALTKVGSAFYGVASSGGPGALGSIFKVDLKAGTVETVHAFQGTDGAQPLAGLTYISGNLYGTTDSGGTSGQGTLFSFDPHGRTLTTLHSFTGDDGQRPRATLTVVGGKAYGTTIYGGKAGLGVIYSLDLATFKVTKINDVTAMIGESSDALTELGGELYGTGAGGGTNRSGDIFKLDPATGQITVLYSFAGGQDGGDPGQSLCAFGGVLYGSAGSGEAGEPATLFKFDPATNTKTILRTLAGTIFIDAPFVPKGDKLFGTFAYATHPAAPAGGVLRLDPATSDVKFFPAAGSTYYGSEAALLPVGNGLLGTASTPTQDNAGYVFKFLP